MVSHVNISLCDALNPDFGYQVRIESLDGRTLLFTSRAPDTGEDLLTLADVLRVVGMYTGPDADTCDDEESFTMASDAAGGVSRRMADTLARDGG